jgi:hypothetical protein
VEAEIGTAERQASNHQNPDRSRETRFGEFWQTKCWWRHGRAGVLDEHPMFDSCGHRLALRRAK